MRFGRRKDKDDGSAGDSAGAAKTPREPLRLGGLSEQDTAVLLTAFTTMLRERGVHTTVSEDGMVETTSGFQMGLDNLATLMPQRPRGEWDAMVAKHVATMIGAIESADQPPMPQEEFLQRVFPRLYRKDPGLPFYPEYRIDLGCELFVVAAIDYPDRVDVVGSDDGLGDRGGWDTVMPHAMANLRSLDAPLDLTESSLRDPTTPRLHRWRADDFFGATRYLLVDEMLQQAGDPVGDLGLLFSVPSRSDLFVAVPTPDAVAGGTLEHAATELSKATVRAFNSRTGNLSPFVYYRAADGTISQVTTGDKDGTITLTLPPALRA